MVEIAITTICLSSPARVPFFPLIYSKSVGKISFCSTWNSYWWFDAGKWQVKMICCTQTPSTVLSGLAQISLMFRQTSTRATSHSRALITSQRMLMPAWVWTQLLGIWNSTGPNKLFLLQSFLVRLVWICHESTRPKPVHESQGRSMQPTQRFGLRVIMCTTILELHQKWF